MSITSNTNWGFTVPEAGEVDSVQNYANIIEEIDNALISPNNKLQLESEGVDQGGTTYDSYSQKYVTTLHYHPTPTSVPEADHATSADYATTAGSATTATKLDPGANINGHLFTGESDITIQTNDIPDAHRVFYGTVAPEDFLGFPNVLRNGDLYVRYTA